MNDSPLLLYRSQAQVFLGVSASKFDDLKKMPGFPKPKVLGGKRPIYLRKELEEWANNLQEEEDGN